MKKLVFIYHYFKHRLKATSEHGVHSPFVYDLVTNVIYVKAKYASYKMIESLREQLIASPKTIRCTDLGAGKQTSSDKKISQIAKKSAKSAEQAQLLFRLVNHFQPAQVIELGTSLGISTAYLASANSNTKIITLEGCPETAEAAKQNFKYLKLKNIEQIVGNFDDLLPKVLQNCDRLDFVFIDGNHRKDATLNYFNLCLNKVNENSVLIFDDIYWSNEMMEAWNEIKNAPQVTVTIDLFFMGIVFFRQEQAKQHFLIRF